jgi:hypothetical protein
LEDYTVPKVAPVARPAPKPVEHEAKKHAPRVNPVSAPTQPVSPAPVSTPTEFEEQKQAPRVSPAPATTTPSSGGQQLTGLTSEQQGSFVPQAFRTLAGDKNKTMAALQGIKYGGYPFSILEGAGFTYGKRNAWDFLRKTEGDPILSEISLVDAFKDPSTPYGSNVVGEYKSNKITLQNQHLYNPDTIRHEGMHNLVDNMARKGDFFRMPFDEVQELIDKFDLKTAGTTPSVQDFIRFVGLESDYRQKEAGMTQTVRNADGTMSPAFDPRMRTAGWDYDKTDKWGISREVENPYEGSGSSPVLNMETGKYEYTKDSSGLGKKEWDKWVAYQRELPPESMGGAVAGYGSKTAPWGPATVWRDENLQPIGTGSGWANTSQNLGNVPLYQPQTGLQNWPMAYTHALTQAQSQKYGSEEAQFNKSVALTAHPDSRIRALYEANLPEKVLDKIQDYLIENKWTPTMHYKEVMNYINNVVNE